jgi:uncharacterized protein
VTGAAGGLDPALARQRFEDLILGGTFPCLGAAGAVRRGEYRLRTYPPLGSPASVRACAADLDALLAERPPGKHPVTILAAVFAGPAGLDEQAFEDLMWWLLRGLREWDMRRPACRHLAGRDDADPGFGYGDRDFFIVGMHPGSSRLARRFPWPTLVFNALTHSELLRKQGRYELMQQRIRARDLRLQGTLNPNLERCQAAQFSGRDVGDNWTCPPWFGCSSCCRTSLNE